MTLQGLGLGFQGTGEEVLGIIQDNCRFGLQVLGLGSRRFAASLGFGQSLGRQF